MNPALPGGASSIDGALAENAWGVSARVGYAFVPYGRLQQGTATAPNPSELRVDVHLVTLQATATAPTNTSLDLQLPYGSLVASSIAEDRVDSNVGDLELRVRQSTRAFGSMSLGIAAGIVIPTGPYAARAGAANTVPEASYLTLGRGVPWWLAEVDARRAIVERLATFVQLAGRGPLSRASDGFRWGTEVRATLGARVDVTRRLGIVATSELQHRGRASEPDPFSGDRLEAANAGGLYWSGSLAAAIDITSSLALVTGVRTPFASSVVGNQLVPQTGVFASVAYTGRIAQRRRSPASIEPVRGEITVVDYWATWCAPCATISRALEQAAQRWPDVRIVKVDATTWPSEDAPTLPAGAAGLPVVEIFDHTGARRALLTGADALNVVEKVDELRASNSRDRSVR